MKLLFHISNVHMIAVRLKYVLSKQRSLLKKGQVQIILHFGIFPNKTKAKQFSIKKDRKNFRDTFFDCSIDFQLIFPIDENILLDEIEKERWEGKEKKICVNFINILLATFLHKSVWLSFSLITVWLCNFLAKEYGRKSCS